MAINVGAWSAADMTPASRPASGLPAESSHRGGSGVQDEFGGGGLGVGRVAVPGKQALDEPILVTAGSFCATAS